MSCYGQQLCGLVQRSHELPRGIKCVHRRSSEQQLACRLYSSVYIILDMAGCILSSSAARRCRCRCRCLSGDFGVDRVLFADVSSLMASQVRLSRKNTRREEDDDDKQKRREEEEEVNLNLIAAELRRRVILLTYWGTESDTGPAAK